MAVVGHAEVAEAWDEEHQDACAHDEEDQGGLVAGHAEVVRVDDGDGFGEEVGQTDDCGAHDRADQHDWLGHEEANGE